MINTKAPSIRPLRALPIWLPIGVAAAGLLVYVAALVLMRDGELGSLFDVWLYHVVLGMSGLACLARAWLDRPERLAWAFLGAGLVAWTAGDVYWTIDWYYGGGDIQYPSLADAGYITAYPLMYVGILMLIRRRAQFTASGWLDGLIGGLAATALGVAVLAPALVGLTDGDPAAVATNLAYPLGDVLLVGFVVTGAILARGGLAWMVIGAGLATWGLADGIYLYQEATSAYNGGFLDALWLLGALLIALAAGFRAPLAHRGPATQSMVLPCTFALVAVAVLVWDHFDRVHELSIWLASATLAVVILRLAFSFRENNALLRVMHSETVTDDLTGLANRRALLADLDQLFGSTNGRTYQFTIFDLDGFKAYNDSFGHPAGDVLLRRMGRRLAAATAPTGTAYRLGGDEFCVVNRGAEAGFGRMLAAARQALTERGEGFEIGCSTGEALIPLEASDPSAALRIADDRLYAEKGRRSSSAERQTRDVLVRILREREPDLSAHLVGVAKLAVEVGQDIGMASEEMDVLARAAELHDVGKIGIPDGILHKPGPLDASELEVIRTHTLIGERILRAAPAMVPVAELVRSSHERWDGAGYPDGLAGDDIPFGARIIFICDAFDAITSDRPYRTARTESEALEELRRNSGTQFDPSLIERFFRVHAAAAVEAEAASSRI